MKTVYISIGNSDDKLPQSLWSAFVYEVGIIANAAGHKHGNWVSPSAYAFQNACWCIEVPAYQEDLMKLELAKLAAKYGQDSIAWAEATTTFIRPSTSEEPT